MSILNLSDWINNRGIFEDIEVEGVALQIVSLNKSLKEELENLDTYQDMFNFVADVGLSHERARIFDNEELAKDLPVIWALEEFNQKCDPSIKEQIVSLICELSGISDVLELKQLEEQEAKDESMIIDGDSDIENVTLGQLHADANAANINA